MYKLSKSGTVLSTRGRRMLKTKFLPSRVHSPNKHSTPMGIIMKTYVKYPAQ
jgi:hypothetical protein